MADDVSIPAKRQKTVNSVSRDELWNSPREELISRILKQQQEIETLQSKQAPPDQTLDDLRETVEKLKMQVTESARQENILVIRLANKEQEIQELVAQIQEAKAQNPSSAQLQALLLDPAINLMFQHMKQEMDLLKNKLDQAQKDLAAWKFTPDSQTGKRLMAKCRMLLQENEELGKTVSSGRMAKLEGDIALQKKLILEMKKSETETEEFLADMDEDMEAMQGTVYLLQQELKETKDRLQKYEQLDATNVNNNQPEQQDGSPNKQQDSSLSVLQQDASLSVSQQDVSLSVLPQDASLSVTNLCREDGLTPSIGIKTEIKTERTDLEEMDHDGICTNAGNENAHIQAVNKLTDVTNGKAYPNQVIKTEVGVTRPQQRTGKFADCNGPVTNPKIENDDSVDYCCHLSEANNDAKDVKDAYRTAPHCKSEGEPTINGIVGQHKKQVDLNSSSDVSE